LEIDALDSSALITDALLLRKSLILLSGVIIGFLIQDRSHRVGDDCIERGNSVNVVGSQR